MRAILLNPFDQTVKEVVYTGDFREIYSLIDCTTFDVVRLSESDDMYVDDEGMLANMNYFFRYTNDDFYVEPVLLAGKGLIVGTNEEGEDIEPELTVEDIRSRIKFLGRKALH